MVLHQTGTSMNQNDILQVKAEVRPLPTSMDWFRQSANWLVGLSSGGLAWLGSMYFDKRIDHIANWVDLLYAAAALAFVIAIIAGVSFYSWLTNFASHYEKETESSKPGPKETEPAPAIAEGADPNGTTSAPVAPPAAEKGRSTEQIKAERKYAFYFNILKWAFPIAVVFTVGVVVAQRVVAVNPMATTGSILLIDGRAQDSTHVGFSVLKLDTKTGLVLELFNDSANGWVRWDTCHAFAREVMGTDEVRVR